MSEIKEIFNSKSCKKFIYKSFFITAIQNDPDDCVNIFFYSLGLEEQVYKISIKDDLAVITALNAVKIFLIQHPELPCSAKVNQSMTDDLFNDDAIILKQEIESLKKVIEDLMQANERLLKEKVNCQILLNQAEEKIELYERKIQ